ncbi:MAG: hypothetical protein RIQ89_756 [Bacteroidota bacterium]
MGTTFAKIELLIVFQKVIFKQSNNNMLTSSEIRQKFLQFFESKQHAIVASAPMVVKNDPTLMFINSGMAPFKDLFLGNQPIKNARIADTQKCLRVSGKHNDLEEVGIDTYHHTLFEMLGNWSFGSNDNNSKGYFKNEAIAWAWELLTEVYQLNKSDLYVTVFEGDQKEQLEFDKESFELWKKYLPEEKILRGNKKDNFWEMGDQGPCGPCTEIHIDLRTATEKQQTPGASMVNSGHPQVIEVWNLVFMQYNRKADGSLVLLPAKHVDTGMGFERLCMALQGKQSNYDTDVFQPIIQQLSLRSGIAYTNGVGQGSGTMTNVAMRVIADHIRAIACAIADGQLPSNNKAGYVIRRILRRAVRYGYTYLNFKSPVLNTLVPILAEQFKQVFPEVKQQQDFIVKVITEEEQAFLRTLETGIKRFEDYKEQLISGAFAFELYDTFGFPIDLTQLMAREQGKEVDMDAFNNCLLQQKERSRAASAVETQDWVILKEAASNFIGYDQLHCSTQLLRYRTVSAKGKKLFQLILEATPFYAESGGQVGDKGTLQFGSDIIQVIDTQKENNLIIHVVEELPLALDVACHAQVDVLRRKRICANHSATHLLHSALKQVLGSHVNQKGSLVNDEHTRFDFSHFTKVTDEECEKIEAMVNDKIWENISLQELRAVPIAEAQAMGATALFGEKYGDLVRVIIFDKAYSIELCGGTHVNATGSIGMFKITSEGAVAAGVRRIVATTGVGALNYYKEKERELDKIYSLLKQPKDAEARLELMLVEQQQLTDKLEAFTIEKVHQIKSQLQAKVRKVKGLNLIAESIDISHPEAIKNLSFELRQQIDNLVLLLGNAVDGKAQLSLMLSDNLVAEKKLNATVIIKELAKDIQGGGGGQPFYATAGGKKPEGISMALNKIETLL